MLKCSLSNDSLPPGKWTTLKRHCESQEVEMKANWEENSRNLFSFWVLLFCPLVLHLVKPKKDEPWIHSLFNRLFLLPSLLSQPLIAAKKKKKMLAVEEAEAELYKLWQIEKKKHCLQSFLFFFPSCPPLSKNKESLKFLFLAQFHRFSEKKKKQLSNKCWSFV